MAAPAPAAVRRLGALAGLARAHVLGDVDVLARPEGEAPHQRPRLGPPEVSPERAVAALAESLRVQSAAGEDAEPVRRALAAAIEEAATYYRNVPSLGVFVNPSGALCAGRRARRRPPPRRA